MSTGIYLLQSGYLNLVQNEPALLILEIFLMETLRVGEIGFHQTSVGLFRGGGSTISARDSILGTPISPVNL